MPALPTLRPNGDGTASNMNAPVGDTTRWGAVDDPVATNDGDTTYIEAGANLSGSAFFLLTDMPADFSAMVDLTAAVAVRVAGTVSNDTLALFAQVFRADETTALTGEVQLADQAVGVSYVARSAALTSVTAGDKTIWDGARLRLRWAYVKSGPTDSYTIRVSAAELTGNYATPVTTTTHRTRLAAATDPGRDDYHKLRVNARSVQGGGTLTYALEQAGAPLTTAASFTASLTNAFQTFTATLTTAQAGAITDYGALDVTLSATKSTGPMDVEVEWVEFELPAAAASSVPFVGWGVPL